MTSVPYVFEAPSEWSFEKVGIRGKIYPFTDRTDELELVFIHCEESHGTVVMQRESLFVYYVCEGSGVFRIEGEDHAARKGDTVVIPRGTRFTYEGRMDLLLVAMPPWRPEQEEETPI